MSPLTSLHSQMNRLFDEAFRGFEASLEPWQGRAWPSIDVEESERQFRIIAEVPGMEPRDIEVVLQDGVLILRGERKSTSEESGRVRERFYGRFERRMALGGEIDQDAVQAHFNNGILTVTVPKSAHAMQRTKRIPVDAGEKTH